MQLFQILLFLLISISFSAKSAIAFNSTEKRDSCIEISDQIIKGKIIADNKGISLHGNNIVDTIIINNGLLENNGCLLVKHLEINNATFVNNGIVYVKKYYQKGAKSYSEIQNYFWCKNFHLSDSAKLFLCAKMDVEKFHFDKTRCFVYNECGVVNSRSNIVYDKRHFINRFTGNVYLIPSEFIDFRDITLIFSYLLISFLLIWIISKKYFSEHKPKWILSAFLLKLLMGFFLLYIYFFYYGDGDVFNYAFSSQALAEYISHSPANGLKILSGDNSGESIYRLYAFSNYQLDDFCFYAPNSFAVIRILSIIILLSGNSIYSGLIVFNLLSFLVILRFFKTLTDCYPSLSRYFFISLFLIPGFLEWSSVFLKEAVVIPPFLLIISALHHFTKSKKNIPIWTITIFISAAAIFFIKPYFLIPLIPLIPAWLGYNWIIKSKRTVAITSKALLLLFSGLLLLQCYMKIFEYQQINEDYQSISAVINKANVVKKDHLRSEQYGDNTYETSLIKQEKTEIKKTKHVSANETEQRDYISEILDFFGNLVNDIYQVIASLFAGLFRPIITDIKKPIMIIAGIEGTILLMISCYILLKIKIKHLFQKIFSDPFLLVLLAYVLIFSFGIGYSSSNLGALYRFRSVIIPLYLIILIILLGKSRINKIFNQSRRILNFR